VHATCSNRDEHWTLRIVFTAFQRELSLQHFSRNFLCSISAGTFFTAFQLKIPTATTRFSFLSKRPIHHASQVHKARTNRTRSVPKLLQFVAIQDIVASSMSNRADLDPRPRFQANLVLRLVSGSPKSCATGTVVPNVTRSPQ
jgi:hypothetical protein